MSSANLNEKESELKLAFWKQKWEIAKEILKTKERSGTLTQTEDEIIEDLKIIHQKEDRWNLLKYLKERHNRNN